MRKTIIIMLISSFLLMPGTVMPTAYAAKHVQLKSLHFTLVTDDGMRKFDMPVVEVDKKIYVPLQDIGTQLGYSIEVHKAEIKVFKEKVSTAYLVLDAAYAVKSWRNVRFSLMTDYCTIKFSMRIVPIDSAAFVPLRDICYQLGYRVEAKEEGINLFPDATFKSYDGALDNGRKYHYFGRDRGRFDLKKYVKDNVLTDVVKLKYEIVAPTPDILAKKYQAYIDYLAVVSKKSFSANAPATYYVEPVDEFDFIILYDEKIDVWMLRRLYISDRQWTGKGVETISRKDGSMCAYLSPAR